MNSLTLGLRLALRGGSGRGRTAVMAAGIALCTLLLLSLAATTTMLHERHDRIAAREPAPGSGDASVLLVEASDVWQGRPITRMLVAELRPTPPPPGLAVLPATGQRIVSPALAELMTQPGGQDLAARYASPGMGTIAKDGLAGPEELIAWIGVSEPTLRHTTNVVASSGFGRSFIDLPANDDHIAGTVQGLGFVAVILLAMIVVFMAVSVRLSATILDRRLAAMRLAGASIKQAHLIVAGEMLIATTLGAALGAVCFLVLRALSAGWSIGGLRWYTSDLDPGAAWIVVLVGVPLLGHIVAQLGGRRAIGSSFEVRRGAAVRISPRLRLVPGALGLILLVAVALPVMSANAASPVWITGTVVTLVALPIGLSVVLRWLFGRVAARATSTSTLLAARRVHYDPTAATRVAAGLGLAIVILAVVGAVITDSSRAAAGFVTTSQARTADHVISVDAQSGADVEAVLEGLAGVTKVVPIRTLTVGRAGVPPFVEEVAWIVACSDAMQIVGADPAVCPPGSVVRTQNSAGGQRTCDAAGNCTPFPAIAAGDVLTLQAPEVRVLTTVSASGSQVQLPFRQFEASGAVVLVRPDAPALHGVALPSTRRFAVLTDGSTAADQRIRTAVLAVDPAASVGTLQNDLALAAYSQAFAIAILEYGGLLALIVALAAELVAGIDALWERRREAAALLCIGMSRAVLRRTLAQYLALPLLVSASIGGAVGALVVAGYGRVGSESISIPTIMWLGMATVLVAAALFAPIIARSVTRSVSVSEGVRAE